MLEVAWPTCPTPTPTPPTSWPRCARRSANRWTMAWRPAATPCPATAAPYTARFFDPPCAVTEAGRADPSLLTAALFPEGPHSTSDG